MGLIARLPPPGRLRTSLWIFGLWTLFGAYNATQARIVTAMSARPYTWRSALVSELTYAYTACALTPLVLWLARRYPFDRSAWIRSLPVHILGMAAFAAALKLVWDAVAGPADGYLHSGFTVTKMLRSILSYSDMACVLYGLIVVMEHAVEYYGRYRAGLVQASELKAQLAQAQVQSLKMQLHPHFLFNTLNSISALVLEDPEGAETMIARLSDLLRMSLENPGAQEVPLSHELKFVNLYLEIERTRFEDRLSVEYDIDADALDALVPNMILQPLVENAIRHGIANRAANGRVSISAKRRGGDLLLKVADNGSGIPASALPALKEGVGLSSTRGRLERLYGAGPRLQLEAPDRGGLIARIALPYVPAAERRGVAAHGTH